MNEDRLFYALPAGKNAVLEACEQQQIPMSALDRKALAEWLALEKARIDRHSKPVDRNYLVIDSRTLDAIVWGLGGPR